MVAGHRAEAAPARAATHHRDPRIRGAALGALGRAGALEVQDLVRALSDPAPEVRRRACELVAAGTPATGREGVLGALRPLVADPDAVVVEAACWALGEQVDHDAVPALCRAAAEATDPRAREAAVAALGAIGDHRGLPAVLDALSDRPAVRRRATVALAAFSGEEVEEALRRCLEDRDWQVRHVAEELLGS